MGRPPSDLPIRIVHAARARFLKDGVDGASLRRIARDAGTNIGMIYYHFRTKHELFLAVVEEVYSKLIADLGEALEGGDGAEQRVRALYARFARMSEHELDVLRLVLREILVSTERRRSLMERFAHGHVPLLAGVVREGIAGGELDDQIPPAVVMIATVLLGMFPQIVVRLGGGALPAALALPAPAELADTLTGILLRGISAR